MLRLGLGAESELTLNYIVTNHADPNNLRHNINTTGMYNVKHDLAMYAKFCKTYLGALQNSTALACFQNHPIEKLQRFCIETYKLQRIHSRSIEPFYVCLQNIQPWTHALFGKKVLIVNPFTESFQKQIHNKFQLCKDNPIFLENQEFVFYKSFQTSVGNHIHENWFETFTIMCNDIQTLDFDIALLGCGGYGLPLCNFITPLEIYTLEDFKWNKIIVKK